MEKWVPYHGLLHMHSLFESKKKKRKTCLQNGTDTFYSKPNTRQYNSKDTGARATGLQLMIQWAVRLVQA
jgi:hypothetical protein